MRNNINTISEIFALLLRRIYLYNSHGSNAYFNLYGFLVY